MNVAWVLFVFSPNGGLAFPNLAPFPTQHACEVRAHTLQKAIDNRSVYDVRDFTFTCIRTDGKEEVEVPIDVTGRVK